MKYYLKPHKCDVFEPVGLEQIKSILRSFEVDEASIEAFLDKEESKRYLIHFGSKVFGFFDNLHGAYSQEDLLDSLNSDGDLIYKFLK